MRELQHDMMNLFAVPLYRSNLQRAFSDEELEFFKAQLQRSHHAIANVATVNKRVLDEAPMESIRADIQAHLDNYFKQVFNTSNDCRLEVTQSWLSLTLKGESHHEHTHPNSVASGVLYINLAENDGINFYRNEENLWYELVRQQETYYNALRYFIQTRVGDIIIFPSNVRHGVKEVTGPVERVSLAFNTFFSGELGRDEFSNSLRVEVKRS